MRPHARRKAYTVLLLMTMALLASGCASDGTYSQTQVAVGVYGAGYYGAYPGYYHGDVIVGAPMPPPGTMPPPGGVRPPGGMPPPGGAPPPHVSQMPARPLPAPAPRPMPAGGGMRGGGGRR
jgi:hypothetical protein